MIVRIYAAQSAQETEMVNSLLRNNCLHPLRLEMSLHISLAGSDLWYYVRIPAAETWAVRELLKSGGFGRGAM